MKKVYKIIIFILIILLLLGTLGYRLLAGPIVGIRERIEVGKYAENYLINKYGDHDYRVTGVRYEYDMDTIFDYSNPVGYWVDFKSDIVSDSWLTINGLIPNNYEVDNDYFVEDYYFPDMDGYDVSNIMKGMEPREEVETILLRKLQNEFEPDAYDVECDYIHLVIPNDYGRIPTLDEIKTDIGLYKVSSFDYTVSGSIENVDEYEEKLKSYFKDKYNVGLDVYFHLENTLISVFLENSITVQ